MNTVNSIFSLFLFKNLCLRQKGRSGMNLHFFDPLISLLSHFEFLPLVFTPRTPVFPFLINRNKLRIKISLIYFIQLITFFI